MQPDSTIVEIYMPNFSEITFEGVAVEPLLGSLGDRENTLAKGDSPPKTLKSSGTLSFFDAPGAEVADGQEPDGPYRLDVEGLHVVSVEKQDGANNDGFVNLTLADDRSFWGRGFMPRWEYRVTNDAGARIENSFFEDIVTLQDLVAEIVKQFPFSPTVSRVPKEWETEAFFQFRGAPFERPRKALGRFLEKYPARVALNHDRTVAFYLEGEGSVGHTKIRGGENDLPLPRRLLQDLGGQGHVDGIEFANRPTHILVVGGPRYITTDVEMEPVVMVQGRPFPMLHGLALINDLGKPEGAFSKADLDKLFNTTERAGVRTSSTQKLKAEIIERRLERAWVKHWGRVASRRVLKPKSKRAGFSPVYKAIDEDAYRLFRVKGADDGLSHILPLGNRAETIEGKRLPPLAYTATFKKRSGMIRLMTSPWKGAGGSTVSPGGAFEVVPPGEEKKAQEDLLAEAEARLAAARTSVETNAVAAEPILFGDLDTMDAQIKRVEQFADVFTDNSTWHKSMYDGVRDYLFTAREPIDEFINEATFGLEAMRAEDLSEAERAAERIDKDGFVINFTDRGAGKRSTGTPWWRQGLNQIPGGFLTNQVTELAKRVASIYAASLQLRKVLLNEPNRRTPKKTIGKTGDTFTEQVTIVGDGDVLPGSTKRASRKEWTIIQAAIRDGVSQLKYIFLAEIIGAEELAEEASEARDTIPAAILGEKTPEERQDPLAAYKAALEERNKLVNFKETSKKLVEQLDKVGQLLIARNFQPKAEVLKAADIAEQVIFERAQFVGEKKYAPLPVAIYYTNEPISENKDFKVVDKNLGLIRFNKPQGHLNQDNAATTDGLKLVPRPVILRYGRAHKLNDNFTVGGFVDPKTDLRADIADALEGGGGVAGGGAVSAGLHIEVYHRFYKITSKPPVVALEGDSNEVPGVGAASGSIKKVQEANQAFTLEQLNDVDAVYSARTLESGNTRVIYDQSLVELVPKSYVRRDGTLVEHAGNVEDLDKRANQLARNAVHKMPQFKVSQRLLYLRPFKVNCNGVISGVQVSARQELRGCQTQLFLGSEVSVFPDDTKTRTRDNRKAQDEPEAIKLPRIDVSER